MQAEKPRARLMPVKSLWRDVWIVWCGSATGFGDTLDEALASWRAQLLRFQTYRG